MTPQNNYVKGIFWNEPSEKAPEWVKGRISFKVKDVIEYLQANENERGYVNVNVKISRNGDTYLELDTWQPNQQKIKQEKPPRNIADLESEDTLQENEMPRF